MEIDNITLFETAAECARVAMEYIEEEVECEGCIQDGWCDEHQELLDEIALVLSRHYEN